MEEQTRPTEEKIEALWETAARRGMSRRRFLSLLAVGGAGAVLAACTDDEEVDDTTTTDTEGEAEEAEEEEEEAEAAARNIHKPIPDRWFIRHGETNVETRFEVMSWQEYHTPNALFFVRSHDATPEIDIEEWRLEVTGDGIENELSLTYDDILALPAVTITRFLECTGNGRSFFEEFVDQPGQGSQWKLGAYGIADWTGVRLRDVLEMAGLKNDAVDVMPIGLDEPRIERPLPVEKALEDESILAYMMNGDLLPPDHGFPLRALVPGWGGISSIKWVGEINVSTEPIWTDKNTNAYVMIGPDYEEPEGPPKGPPTDEQIMKSAVALPWPATIPPGPQEIVGYAWSPHGTISGVEVSLDDGETFEQAELEGPNEPMAGTRWRFAFDAQDGEMTITTRASDDQGNTQYPISEQTWNELGYLFGAMVPHPVTVSSEEATGNGDGATTTTTAAAAATTTTAAAQNGANGAAGGATAGQLAQAGRTVFDAECVRCHGEQGEGVTAPALIGTSLARFRTGTGLMDYIRRTMPADRPGSLSQQQAFEVTVYVLLENGHVEEDEQLTQEDLGEIQL
jgi:sulfane dehydrogenase subunit SoxC